MNILSVVDNYFGWLQFREIKFNNDWIDALMGSENGARIKLEYFWLVLHNAILISLTLQLFSIS